MPTFSTSNWLKHEDLDDTADTIVTICGYEQKKFEENGETKRRWAIAFQELDTPLLLNATNGQAICSALENREMNEWIGKKIALYVDHNVKFGTKKVSAIRIRSTAPLSKRESSPKPSGAPSSHGASVSIQDSPALWTQPDEYEGLLLSQVPTDHLQTWLQTYPQADINLRKAVRRDLAERDE